MDKIDSILSKLIPERIELKIILKLLRFAKKMNRTAQAKYYKRTGEYRKSSDMTYEEMVDYEQQVLNRLKELRDNK